MATIVKNRTKIRMFRGNANMEDHLSKRAKGISKKVKYVLSAIQTTSLTQITTTSIRKITSDQI